jgi:hypothetical protein
MSRSRYTVFGSEEIDRTIDSHMKTLVSAALAAVGDRHLAAIILGGGYGRGEGGVTIRAGKESLYNDYDIFVVSNGLSMSGKREMSAKFSVLSARLSEEFGIEVDFSPPKNVSELRRLDYEMVWYEGKKGHIVLWGDEHVFAAIPEWDIKDMPHAEAARLLMNRGMGLLLASRKMRSGEPDRETLEFAERNAWKAVMAAGDTFLILKGRYDSSYVKRGENFKALSQAGLNPGGGLSDYYGKSIHYKLSPPAAPLAHKECAELLEMARGFLLNAYLPVAASICGLEISSFAQLPSRLPDLTPVPGLKNTLKNIILNSLKFRGRAGFGSTMLIKHPRSRIFAAIPYFLGAGINHAEIDAILGGMTGQPDDEKRFTRLKSLWERFS